MGFPFHLFHFLQTVLTVLFREMSVLQFPAVIDVFQKISLAEFIFNGATYWKEANALLRSNSSFKISF